jgi:hypothetical protein
VGTFIVKVSTLAGSSRKKWVYIRPITANPLIPSKRKNTEFIITVDQRE